MRAIQAEAHRGLRPRLMKIVSGKRSGRDGPERRKHGPLRLRIQIRLYRASGPATVNFLFDTALPETPSAREETAKTCTIPAFSAERIPKEYLAR